MSHKSELIRVFSERGYIHQATNLEGLDEKASQQIIPAYIGFDCTADSLHVGSLVQIMMLRALQRAGHKPIVLMGGGTTKVGDPSGKDDTRKLLDHEAIAVNMTGIKQVFEKYVSTAGRFLLANLLPVNHNIKFRLINKLLTKKNVCSPPKIAHFRFLQFIERLL